MWVVKLGGSLAADPLLRDWLEMLADCGRGRVVIVPGGGPFADRVREAQEHWGFDDGPASRMAILAMEQYAEMLSGLCPSISPVASQDAMVAVLKAAGVALWLPTAMLSSEPELAKSWRVTSDSLAAWLAQRLNARFLILVKSCELPVASADIDELARIGVVDEAFPEFVRGRGFDAFILNKTASSELRYMLMSLETAAALSDNA